MRARSMVKWFVVLATLAYAPAPADAQNGSGSPPPSTINFGGNVGMNPQQELTAGAAAVTSASSVSSSVQQMLQTARQNKDVVKTICLNDVLSQVNAAQRTMSERQAQLASAAGANDTDLANHEYTILTVLGQRIAQLQTEANNCVGTSDTSMSAQTLLTITGDLPPGDSTPPPWSNDPNVPTPPPVGPAGEVAPPAPCSPQK